MRGEISSGDYFHTLFALSAGTEAQHHPSTPCRSLQASPLPCPRRAELSLPSPRTHRALPSLTQGSEQTFCSSLELRAVNSAALPSIWPRACPWPFSSPLLYEAGLGNSPWVSEILKGENIPRNQQALFLECSSNAWGLSQ